MPAEQSLRSGNLEEALKELQTLIRKEPAVSKHRVFLFQLYVVLGEWERARTQLNVLHDLDSKTVPMVQTYRQALRCEVLRAEVFAGRRTPLLFGEPAQWAALLVQALALSAKGQVQQAQQLRAQALEQVPAVPGKLTFTTAGAASETTQPFQWLADGDTRLGPLLEAIVNGKYYWVPWSAVRQLRLERPIDLRDLVWLPASFTWRNGGEAVGLLPARYPGSEDASAELQLGRRIEWQDLGHAEFHGLGQKLIATDAGEYGLLDLRSIQLSELPPA